jgi:glycyl-tRNA synthetase
MTRTHFQQATEPLPPTASWPVRAQGGAASSARRPLEDEALALPGGQGRDHGFKEIDGVERLVMAVLCSAFENDPEHERIVLKLPAHIAPVKYCVSPLLKNKPELVAKAREVYTMLKKKHGAVMWDDNGNIGKRYRRQDEIGTPYCVVVDFDTLEDGTVTVRDRDTTDQKRCAVAEL